MEPALRIKLFGAFRVERDGTAVPAKAWPQRKTQSLLKLLVAQRGQVFMQDQLIDHLFADSDLEVAAKNLHKRVSELRKLLEPELGRGADSRYVRRVGQGYCFPKDAPCWVDVEAFDALLAQAREAEAAGDWPAALSAYARADALYEADFLSEDLYEEWTQTLRDHWRERHLDALERLAESHARTGQFAEAIRCAQRALASDAHREGGYRKLMRYYWRTGEQSKVSQTYHRCLQAFESWGIAPSPETLALYRQIEAGEVDALERMYAEPAPAPSAASSGPSREPPHNLPRPLTSFVGRAHDLERVRSLLEANRLVTLTGVGGSGKTRLAIQAIHSLVPDFSDGVWLVELASLTDPAWLVQTVAAALGIPETGQQPLEDTLRARLGDKNLLLVLDNCEHVLSGCAPLASSLLAHCPEVRILATSREPLNVPGEVVWPVAPLPVPSEASEQPAQLASSEAVQLFSARVRAVRPDFEVGPHNAGAIALLCRRLDDIPLALELAAARAKALSVRELAARLDDRFRLLTGGSRTALPRHRTLEAALDWSYGLLHRDERALLTQLSAFRGGCDLEAVEAVCAWGELPPSGALDAVEQLVQKSLVEMELSHGHARYRLLETVQQYAAAKLAAGGEETEVRRRHAGHAVALAERADEGLKGEEQGSWLQRLDADHDNLRAALSWLLAHDPAQAVRLAGALGRFWWMHSHFTEGTRWLAESLAAAPAETPAGWKARALLWSGGLAVYEGNTGRARESLTASLALYREAGELRGMASALSMLGNCAFQEGHYEEARGCYEGSLDYSQQLGDWWAMARHTNNLGLVAYRRGDFEVARALHERALSICRSLEDRHGVVLSLENLGHAVFALGDHAGARAHYRDALELSRALGDPLSIAYSLTGLASTEAQAGSCERAALWLGIADCILCELGAVRDPIEEDRYAETRRCLQRALGEGAFERQFATGHEVERNPVIDALLADA